MDLTGPPPAPVIQPILNTHSMLTRSKTGVFKLKVLLVANDDPFYEPSTFAQASKSVHWQTAMQNEFDALLKNNIWSLVPPLINCLIISCKWVYKVKLQPNGSIERIRHALWPRAIMNNMVLTILRRVVLQ